METKTALGGEGARIRFKSYYVVWKLHMTAIKNIAQAKFKSYYVVWKLHLTIPIALRFVRLNRTM